MPGRTASLAVALTLANAVSSTTIGAQALTRREVSEVVASEMRVWKLQQAHDEAALDSAILGSIFVDAAGFAFRLHGDDRRIRGELQIKQFALSDTTVMALREGALVSYGIRVVGSYGARDTTLYFNCLSVWQRRFSEWHMVAHSEAPVDRSRPQREYPPLLLHPPE